MSTIKHSHLSHLDVIELGEEVKVVCPSVGGDLSCILRMATSATVGEVNTHTESDDKSQNNHMHCYCVTPVCTNYLFADRKTDYCLSDTSALLLLFLLLA